MKKIFLIAAVAIPLVLAGVFSSNACRNGVSAYRQTLEARKASWARLQEYVRKAVKACRGETAFVIKDLNTGWQIDSHKDAAIPSASLVKIPIMLSYFCAANEGKIKLDGTITLKQSDKTEGSGTVKNALSGTNYKIADLIYFMITESDNTAANMLIENMGLDELNRYFSKFGLKNTNISRKMMDFKLRKDGVENYTTAGDMAYILERLYRGRFVNKDISKKCLSLLAEQKINDRIPKKLPSDIIVAHKTGLENGVCHDVGIVYTVKGDFLICVLTKHEYVSARPTKRLISRLSLLTYNYYSGF